MYKKILGPLDGSVLSEFSLDHIKTIATGCNVPEVILLYVFEKPVTFGGFWGSMEKTGRAINQLKEAEDEALKKAQDYLDMKASNLKREGIQVKTFVSHTETGKGVAENILDYADEENVDLIIMSTHGLSGMSRWAFGSVANRVVHNSKIPVMMIIPPGFR